MLSGLNARRTRDQDEIDWTLFLVFMCNMQTNVPKRTLLLSLSLTDLQGLVGKHVKSFGLLLSQKCSSFLSYVRGTYGPWAVHLLG